MARSGGVLGVVGAGVALVTLDLLVVDAALSDAGRAGSLLLARRPSRAPAAPVTSEVPS